MKTSRRRTNRRSPAGDILPFFEYSQILNSSLDLSFLLNTVLLTVMGKTLVARGMVLVARGEDRFEVLSAKGGLNRTVGKSVSLTDPPRKRIDIAEKKPKEPEWMEFFRSANLKILIPIQTPVKVVGLLSLGPKTSGKRFSASDMQLLESLINLSGSAIEKAMIVQELKTANRSIDQKLQELNTLFDLSKVFNQVLDTEKVVRLLTFSLLGQVGVNRYAICLLEHKEMRTVASRIDDVDELARLVPAFSTLDAPRLTEDLARDRVKGEGSVLLKELELRAVIPMQIQNETKGLIFLGEKLRGGGYTRGDLEFLYSLGNLAIISIENARLFKEAIEKQKLEDELQLAREIQKGLLPQSIPNVEGYEIAAVNISSQQVGGDYYDVIKKSDHQYVLAIGDVSGKGAPAALLMANIQAALRALAPMNYSISEATGRLNDLTCSSTGHGRFITFFWGELDTEKRLLRYVNAGHNPPFLLSASGELKRLSEGGLILGVLNTAVPYQESSVELNKGDVLLLFTDGVSEAMNAADEDFTEERLQETFKTHSHLPAPEILTQIRHEVERFSSGIPQSDDLTMLVVKIL